MLGHRPDAVLMVTTGSGLAPGIIIIIGSFETTIFDSSVVATS